jgi:hypothetical protein
MTDPETGEEEIRYVGKGGGSRKERFERHLPLLVKGTHPNKYLREWSQIPGVTFRSIKVFEGLTEDEAFYGPNGEVVNIALYGRFGQERGPLANMTDGGDGASGAIRTPEHRAKISAANKGEKHHFYGKTHSAEHRAKISAATKGENNPNYGKTYTHTLAARAKMSESRVGENNSFYGKTHTYEALEKMSAANKGKVPWNKGISTRALKLAAD